MFTLKLYRQSEPDEPVEIRTIDMGDLAVGRDAGAGWVIEDADAQISRLHCILAVRDGRLTLQDLSSNGVFIGDAKTRAVYRERMPLPESETLYLGAFMMTVEPGGEDGSNAKPRGPSLIKPAVLGVEALSLPPDWTEVAPRKKPAAPVAGEQDNALSDPMFKAFCEGARLSPSDFKGEDALAVMRRAGEVYQKTVLCLSGLMSERQATQEDHGVDQTTIAPAKNNPFKFAATSQLGVDLLRAQKRGFLTSADAIKAAFTDVKKHLVCMLTASRAVLTTTLEALNPERVSERLKDETFVLGNKNAAAWREYERFYLEFRLDALSNPNGSVDAAFRAAYERQRQELEEASTLC